LLSSPSDSNTRLALAVFAAAGGSTVPELQFIAPRLAPRAAWQTVFCSAECARCSAIRVFSMVVEETWDQYCDRMAKGDHILDEEERLRQLSSVTITIW
jgi:hypothetical protein